MDFNAQLGLIFKYWGRQWCTLRHVVSLYIVHPLFTICTLEKFSKNRKKPIVTVPQDLMSRSHTCDHLINEAVVQNAPL
ncbi:hypothetical protein SFRURICE_009123 [Spodoptera frugiperda]|nr:hypothetical protein SFRURICE_009123 [Spodoptera frugiperda]